MLNIFKKKENNEKELKIYNKNIHLGYNEKQSVILQTNFKEKNRKLDIFSELLNSLPDKDIQIIDKKDLDKFSIDILNPENENYKPFFFNRKSEYGENHLYYESLCHGLPTREIIYSCSARYNIEIPHQPCTLEIVAFIEAVRNLNKNFIKYIHDSLNKIKDMDKKISQKFIDGIFRNVAIQYHYKQSKPMEQLFHVDHILSALHMAITLNGERSVGFSKNDLKIIKLEMKKGDIYVTTPAFCFHGVEIKENKDKSIAIQFRTLLNPIASKILSNNYKKELNQIINHALEKYNIKIPSYQDWSETFENLKRQYIKNNNNIPTIVFENKRNFNSIIDEHPNISKME
jgi:hypothetical protein